MKAVGLVLVYLASHASAGITYQAGRRHGAHSMAMVPHANTTTWSPSLKTIGGVSILGAGMFGAGYGAGHHFGVAEEKAAAAAAAAVAAELARQAALPPPPPPKVGFKDRLAKISPLNLVRKLRPGGGGGGGGGRKAKSGGDSVVDALVTKSWEYLLDEARWGSPVTEAKGVKVWKYFLPKGEYGSEGSAVKSYAVVDAPAEAIFDMIFDSGRTKEYNKFSIGRDDIEQLGKTSKIVWNRTAPPGTKRPHDFCTLMHGEVFPNGTYVLMTTATEHPKAKPTNDYLRSEIVLGINHMVPVPGNPKKTQLTVINHVKTKGIPTFLTEKVAAKSAIDFVSKVQEVCGGGGGGASATPAATGAKVPVAAFHSPKLARRTARGQSQRGRSRVRTAAA